MLLAFQIGIGIWLGGLFLISTVWSWIAVAEKISKNRRVGAPWHRGLITN